jgi:hypothetical protein
MSNISTWHKLVETIKPIRPAIRVKWSRDKEPTGWNPWIIIPSDSYLETGGLGPIPFREVEWIEIDPTHKAVRGQLISSESSDFRASIVAALTNAGIRYSVMGENFRVMAADA